MEDWQRQAILTLRGEGKSIREIANIVGCPKSSVHDFITEKNTPHEAFNASLRKKDGWKRVLVLSDNHAGSKVGLTPPSWMFKLDGSSSAERKRIGAMQEEMWDWYKTTLKKIGDVDVLFHLGDAIDGKAHKDGSTGLITASLNEQVEIAEEVLDISATNKVFVYGTNYHTTTGGEDFEKILADQCGALIDGRAWVDVNGVMFDLRHAVGSSNIPNGRASSLSKEYVWNTFWRDKGMQPKSDIFLRGHIHYHTEVSGIGFKAMSCPSLQGPKTKFGERQCSGTVDFGMIVFDVPQNGSLGDVTYKVYSKELYTFFPNIITT